MDTESHISSAQSQIMKNLDTTTNFDSTADSLHTFVPLNASSSGQPLNDTVNTNDVDEEASNVQNLPESFASNIYASPNGVRYWIPDVAAEYKPVINKEYASWDDVLSMYQLYAEKAGFDIRLSTIKRVNKVITHRYIICSRSGKPNCQGFDSMDLNALSKMKRSVNYKVTNCKARIRVKAIKDTCSFELYEFGESHNHPLVPLENIDLTRKKRKLDYSDKDLIHRLSLAKVGASVAHNLQSALKGGQHMVRGTKTDYKNFSRDLRMFICPKDAQMLLNMMEKRAEQLENFSFEKIVCDGELRSLFWADDVSKCNYLAFGDVLAFDATYSTNQYNMIFVPFTGVDHHKKCVTFGAVLLYDETIESYVWLLECFLKAHGTQPKLVLTDQDPTMKQAISRVLNESVHRLCMWHIMDKLPSKVTGDVLENNNLRARIHKLVWNVFISPATFQERWGVLMNDCNLKDHGWLSDMFSIRDQWVPTYFRHIPMCCLMKTTSRCESSNARFKLNSCGSNTLLQFMVCFDIAINGQCYTQRLAEHSTDSTTPALRTHLPIEEHASLIYTRNIFKEVQQEISKAVLYCMVGRPDVVDGREQFIVTQFDSDSDIVGDFKVSFQANDHSVSCSCKLYTRIGYLCRHVFGVFRFRCVKKVPDLYINPRWKKDALPKKVFKIEYRYGVDSSVCFKLRAEALEIVQKCVDRLRLEPEKLVSLVEEMKVIKTRIFEEVSVDPNSSNKAGLIEELIGQSEPVVVSVTAPRGIRNKGCGTNKRLIGPGEKAKAKSKKKKKKRNCKSCGKLAYHDSRNCPLKEGVTKKVGGKDGCNDEETDEDGCNDEEIDEDGYSDEEDDEYSNSE